MKFSSYLGTVGGTTSSSLCIFFYKKLKSSMLVSDYLALCDIQGIDLDPELKVKII